MTLREATHPYVVGSSDRMVHVNQTLMIMVNSRVRILLSLPVEESLENTGPEEILSNVWREWRIRTNTHYFFIE
jgi:hypothetical protein